MYVFRGIAKTGDGRKENNRPPSHFVPFPTHLQETKITISIRNSFYCDTKDGQNKVQKLIKIEKMENNLWTARPNISNICGKV